MQRFRHVRFGCVWFRLGHPNVRTDLKFPKDCMFISFEVVGENEVDLCGYVTGLDTNKMMSLKEAMEMSDGSDDDEYKEEEEEEEEEEKEEEEAEKEMEEEGDDDIDGEEGEKEGEEEEEEDGEEEEEEEEEGEKEEQQQEEHNEASNTSRNAVPFDQPVAIARPAHA